MGRRLVLRMGLHGLLFQLLLPRFPPTHQQTEDQKYLRVLVLAPRLLELLMRREASFLGQASRLRHRQTRLEEDRRLHLRHLRLRPRFLRPRLPALLLIKKGKASQFLKLRRGSSVLLMQRVSSRKQRLTSLRRMSTTRLRR